jgi:hypothetical protein
MLQLGDIHMHEAHKSSCQAHATNLFKVVVFIPLFSIPMIHKITCIHIVSHLFIHIFGFISKWCNQ